MNDNAATLRIARRILNLRPEELGAIAKKILGIKRKIFRIGEFTLWLDPASNLGYQLLSEGEVEEQTKASIETILHEGDIFVDVGANEGWFSLRAARCVGPGGCVYCIEPQERLWPIIIRNFLLNTMTQYRILPYAIGEKLEDVALNLSLSVNSGSTSIVPSFRRHFRKQQQIHCTTLDHLADLYRMKEITLVKMDIEGYELYALKGMQNLLRAGRIRHMLIEFHPLQLERLGQSIDGVVRYIEEFQYHSSDGRVWHGPNVPLQS
jgi:FkbM family methyltransferase